MKYYKLVAAVFFAALLTTGCKKWLDINTDPNNPNKVEAALLLAPIQNNFVLGLQFDGRYLGQYIQNWGDYRGGSATAAVVAQRYEMMGYYPNNDAGAELWRNVYWKGGRNLLDMMEEAQASEKWDYYGLGILLQAWGWLHLTDLHGEIIVKEAFPEDPAVASFNYDSQDTVYAIVDRMLDEAIVYLSRSDGKVSQQSLGRGDLIYNGDRNKWIRFAYGLKAIRAHHLSKKPFYDPDLVIQYVDMALQSNADDAGLPFAGTNSTNSNFWGPIRNNLVVYAQGIFPISLMNSTVFPGAPDPRLPIILTPSGDGIYRGITPGVAASTTVPLNQQVVTPWGTRIGFNTTLTGLNDRYIFKNNSRFPIMTYAELQFIKAEAAWLKGDFTTALTAYTNGVSAHIDYTRDNSGSALTITPAQKTAYMANPSVIPTLATNLTLSQILLQKYIALYGWGFVESWTDFRRYDYDPSIFTGFAPPATLYPPNGGKLVQRLRPRYNSEYVWNIDALTAIGGFEPDFHTKKIWIVE